MLIGFYIKPDQIGSIQAFPLPVYETIVFVYHIGSGMSTKPLNKTSEAKPPVPKLTPEK